MAVIRRDGPIIHKMSGPIPKKDTVRSAGGRRATHEKFYFHDYVKDQNYL